MWILVFGLFGLLLSSCGGGGNGGSGGNNPITNLVSFTKNPVYVNVGKNTNEILTLNHSISNVNVTVTIKDPNIATINGSSTYTCPTLSSSNPQCSFQVMGIAAGDTVLHATISYDGKTYAVPTAEVIVSKAPLNSGKLSMSVNGITETIYDNQSYNATFTFTNGTSSTINLGKAHVTGTPLGSALTLSSCNDAQLVPGGNCKITINNFHMSTPNSLASLEFKLDQSQDSVEFYAFSMDIVAVDYHPGYAAFRITNRNKSL